MDKPKIDERIMRSVNKKFREQNMELLKHKIIPKNKLRILINIMLGR